MTKPPRRYFSAARIVQVLMAILTLVAVLSYDALPHRAVTLLPHDTLHVSLYNDEDAGGNSLVNWIDQDSVTWSCALNSGYEYPYCGLSVSFDELNSTGQDFSVYTDIKLELDASEKLRQVRVSFRNSHPAYTEGNNHDSMKYMYVTLDPSFLNREITLPLHEFRIPEWWIDRYNISHTHASPDFSSIRALNIDFPFNNPMETHTLTVKKVVLTGDWISEANWYLTIMAAWALYFMIAMSRGAYRFYQKSTMDRELINKMANIQDTLIQRNVEAERESIEDPLTSTFNRRGFEQRLDSLGEGSQQKRHHTIVLIDIDHFKKINDQHGHEVGDEVIRAVADIMREHTRANDTVCRWGGEEFIILSPDCGVEHGYILAEKLRRTIEGRTLVQNPEVRATVSVGVSQYDLSRGFNAAFKAADKALYTAKQSGRNQVVMS